LGCGAGPDQHQAIIDAFYAAHDDAVANYPSHRGDLPWYMKHMANTLGAELTDGEAADLAQAWSAAHGSAMASQALYPDVLENLQRLKTAGAKLYLASGNTKENRAAILRSVGIDQLFSDIFAAGTIGHQKQRCEFWNVVLQLVDVPAASITVVGNQLNDDILHPQVLGMQTILIKRPEESLARTESAIPVTPDHRITTLNELVYEPGSN
jgi:FMN phosphatase YigB (HAD superfamily)